MTNTAKNKQVENSKMSILMIDDDLEFTKIYKMILINYCNSNFTSVGTGDYGYKLITENKYDSIILDIGLPDTTGDIMVKRIRETDNPNKDTPILVMTAFISTDIIKSCVDNGASKVISKGTEYEEVLNLLSSWNADRT